MVVILNSKTFIGRVFFKKYSLYKSLGNECNDRHPKENPLMEMRKMRESTIERKLYNEVKAHGGMALKFVSPTLDGVPDRIVLLPKGKMAFIELKAPGKPLRPLQARRKRQLEALGFLVFKVDHIEQIGGIIDEILSS